MTVRILRGDVRDRLKDLPDESVHCVVTSPPYYGLRDYGVVGQIGLEASPESFIEEMVGVFREVYRVLRADGTAWVNMGDSYATAGGPGWQGKNGQRADRRFTAVRDTVAMREIGRRAPEGVKPKDLMGMPWMLAFALRTDGWWLRQDIIWHKPNPMPESIRDRCTKAHEYLFLLSKSERYYYDFDAMQEEASEGTHERRAITPANWATGAGPHTAIAHNTSETHRKVRKAAPNGSGTKNNASFDEAMAVMPSRRNRRSVWTVPSEAFAEAHFATFPTALIEPCILAGCPVGGTVLDPFGGAGTTGLVADRLERDAILIELNPQYADMAERRIRAQTMPLPFGATGT